MKFHEKIFVFSIVGLLIMYFSSEIRAQGMLHPETTEAILRLEDLEGMALVNNPTVAQAAAAVHAAEGRKIQAGLYPNPTIGYAGEEITVRRPSEKSQHFLFIEQKIVTAGKLRHNRDIFAQEQVQAEVEQQAQKQRVLNTVRLLFYKVLGAQKLAELRGELAKIAHEAVNITEELYNIGQADRPDVLEAEIEAQKAELDFLSAERELQRVWQMLAAVVGNPVLPRPRLVGDLEGEIPRLDQEAIFAKILRESPEIRIAQVRVNRAQIAIQRAKIQSNPDISLRAGMGYDVERFDNGKRAGLTGFVEIGVPIPLFDRNQGNIAAAMAELKIAQEEIRRLKLSLRARLASAFAIYMTSLQTAERYQRNILPRAQKAYDLYLKSFQQMAAAYPQVLIAQRTLFQIRADYVQAVTTIRESVVEIEGMLLIDSLSSPNR
jgi:cobalt-zinc-cadmium efflux system outer membrane protein